MTEVRPGWVVVEPPPPEAWEESLSWLNTEQKRRIAHPEFFERLRCRLIKRFGALARLPRHLGAGRKR